MTNLTELLTLSMHDFPILYINIIHPALTNNLFRHHLYHITQTEQSGTTFRNVVKDLNNAVDTNNHSKSLLSLCISFVVNAGGGCACVCMGMNILVECRVGWF